MSVSVTARKLVAKRQAERRIDREIIKVFEELSKTMSEQELIDVIHGTGTPKWRGRVEIEYVDMPIDPLRQNIEGRP